MITNMLTNEKYEIVPFVFKFYSIIITKPAFCYVVNVKNRKMPVLYPKLAKYKDRKDYTVIGSPFKVSNLHWVRHTIDYPDGNMLTMVFTLGNLRSRKISYRLWGEFRGQIFDITPYFRYYYYRHIPKEIPPVDLKERSYYPNVL
jgi:hypothetical protein